MLMTKVSGVPLDVKAVGDDGTIEGYGSIFGNVDEYGEVVMPGAFDKCLKIWAKVGKPLKMLWQHDRDRPIGLWDELSEDNKGLRVKGRILTEVSGQAAEAYGLIKAGAVDALSIGYQVMKQGPHPTTPNALALFELNLREVSPVTFGANDKARIDAVKHIIAAGELPSVREFEEFLRDAGGFSKRLAAAIAAKATPCLRGEPDGEVDDRLKRFAEAMGVAP